MRAKITKRIVDDIAPATASKPIIVFDTELAGFVLKVTPTGRRVYQLRYRLGGRGSPLRTFTIGVHGPLTPDQARKTAQALLGDVRRGIDPAAVKSERNAEERGALSVQALSTEFLDRYGQAKLKPRSLEEYRRAFRSHINPDIGALKVKDVVHGDVERLHHKMRHMPPTANRTVAALSKFFNWAIKNGYRPDRANPCTGLEKYKERGRERFLSQTEIAAIGAAISQCEASGELTPWQAALIRALMLSGLRRDELRTLKRDAIDVERGVLRLADTKTGPRVVPMSAPLREVLAALPVVAGNPYVFVGARDGRCIINISKPWRRVLVRSGIAATRLHDLRHTVASIAAGAGASLLLIGGVLGHRNQATTQRYSHLNDDAVRATTDAIGARVSAAMAGKDADVVPLRRARSKPVG